MKLRETTECPNCKRLAKQVDRQEAEIADLKWQLAEAVERIGQLEQQLAAARKNSSTSSKPPSSDIVKPKKPRGKGGKKRKRGGQPGHQRHERPEFPPEMVNEFFSYTLDSCPDCGGGLLFSRKADPRVAQQAELIDTPLKITEHKMRAYWCPHCRKVLRVPQGKHAQNLVKRFHQHGDAYFRFITTPGIEPTNNLAEQAIRFVVIDRRITQGMRSETGRRWCERIWTTIATCAQQGRSVFEFLLESVESHLRGIPPPSLLPSGT